jgi:hypothetical protein
MTDYFGLFYTNKLKNLDKTDNFPRKNNLIKLTKKKDIFLSGPISTEKLKLRGNCFYQKKSR